MSGEDEKTVPNPPFFGVEEEVVGRVRLIAVQGELDLNTAPQLEERLEPIFASGDAGLVIDLSGCEFIDSTGIGLIVRAWQRLDADPDSDGDSRFALCGLSDPVRRLLEITGLESSILIYPNRDEALAQLRGD